MLALETTHDRRLADYLTAPDEAAREAALERLLRETVDPRIRTLLAHEIRADRLPAHDADDVMAQVHLTLVRKLRAALVLDDEAIQNVEAYVVTLTQNAVHAWMRRRAPERTRLKARLRYVLLRDPRLAVWSAGDVTVCGLKRWEGRGAQTPAMLSDTPAVVADATRPAEALVALFEHLRTPIRFGQLVELMMQLWGISEARECVDEPAELQHHPVEARQYLRVLWDEIVLLPPRQSAALLLNLREPGGGNALMLLVAAGIATFERMAKVLELTEATLAAIWDDLPLDDLTLAARLGVTRQQVINLRKSARDRLGRRMAARSALARSAVKP